MSIINFTFDDFTTLPSDMLHYFIPDRHEHHISVTTSHTQLLLIITHTQSKKNNNLRFNLKFNPNQQQQRDKPELYTYAWAERRVITHQESNVPEAQTDHAPR